MADKLVKSMVLLTVQLLLLTPAPIAKGESCDGQTCIDVSATSESELVIKVRKGKAGSESTSSPRPRSSATPKKITWIPWWPIVEKKPSVTPKPATTSAKPRTRKPRVKKVEAISLADQVRQLLPSGVIITQPNSALLVREPINFITTVPRNFQTVIVLLDVPVTIDLKARYLWDFGDGTSVEHLTQGAAYPAGTITHTYMNQGVAEVKLLVIWSGKWRAAGISGDIKGAMRAEFERKLMIRTADTRFNQ